MNIERKTVIHLSANDVVTALKAAHPESLPIQALSPCGTIMITALGKGVVLTYTPPGRRAQETMQGVAPDGSAA